MREPGTLELVKAMLRRTQPGEALVAFNPFADFVSVDHRWPGEMGRRNARRVINGDAGSRDAGR